jgi:solute:Na+ symporter, SSS family
LDTAAILTLTSYLLVLVVIGFFWREKLSTEIFSVKKKVPWLVGAVSLFMFYNSPIEAQLTSEVIARDGIAGIWFLSSVWIVSGFGPILFAPIWRSLELKTDNEFVLLRYSGKASRVLFYFRAFYIGIVIAPLVVSSQLLTFAGLLKFLWDIPMVTGLWVAGLCFFVSSCKNSLGITIRTDFFHGILFITAISLVLYYLLREAGSIHVALNQLEEKRKGIPVEGNHKAWMTLAVIFGVQWWSAQLFDGGGAEMQKFNSAVTPKKAFYVGMGALLLSLLIALVNFIMAVLSLAVTPSGAQGFLPSLQYILPGSLKMLVTLGLWAVFITTAESITNWGSSYVVEHLWFRKKITGTDKNKYLLSFGVILGMTLISVFLTMAHPTLRSILELLLSFSAGVAPVFFLRWFWMRINAWAQLSAMIAAVIYSIIYDQALPLFQSSLSADVLDPYYWKLIILTFFTTCTWMTVMYLTPADDPEHIKHFRSRIPARKEMIKRAGWALLAGAVILLIYGSVIFLLSSSST